MKIFYKVDYPVDSGKEVHRGTIELPDDMDLTGILKAGEEAAEWAELADSGEQLRTTMWLDNEDEPFVTHAWDHT